MRRRDVIGGLTALTAAARATQAAPMPGLDPGLPEGTRAIATPTEIKGRTGLIQLSDRPPNFETPVRDLATAITDNDRFFVRYHLAAIPDEAGLEDWKLQVAGDAAQKSLSLSLRDLRSFPQFEVAAVCQCSGNGRGLFQPHVAGVQWGRGAVGCATFRGPRLADVLRRAGLKPDAVEVFLEGADGPVLTATPDFRKSLPIAKAMANETIIATTMNNAPLPLMNGYPARLVVPGWTATYWMKHLTRIEASTKPLDSFWMRKAYRVPAGMFPVEQPFPSQSDDATWPITEIVINSVIAGPAEGSQQPRSGFTVKGVAWDRGHGIKRVEVSLDDGKTWNTSQMGQSLGNHAFRTFSYMTGPVPAGPLTVTARATGNQGETQATALKFNPAGYHNNVPHTVRVSVV